MRHILFVSVFISVLASAASAAEPPADRRAALMLQAQQALQAGREEEALRAWRDAWSLKPSYEIACNIGRIALRMEKAREAASFAVAGAAAVVTVAYLLLPDGTVRSIVGDGGVVVGRW